MDLGVVFPIANGAQVMSKASPHPTPTFELQKTIAQKAEGYGFEYGLAQVTLRGFGGATNHWDESQDSMSLVAGLGLVTENMRLIGSVAIPSLHPAMVARMAVTTSDICGGRLDINLVTGWNKNQYAQMGLWPGDQYYGQRYDYAEEYVTVLRELWENGQSDFKGRFYQLDDCRLGPTPAEPVGLVCAGQSDRGLKFVAEYGDYCYILGTGGGVEGIAAVSEKVQQLAEQYERDLTSHTVVICILGETDEEAQAKERRYVEEADVEAIAAMQRAAGLDVGGGTSARIVDVDNSTFQNIERVTGGPDTVAKYFDEMAEIDGLAGCFIIFDEPVDGVDLFGREVIPRMKSRAAVGS
jgi:pyrimidine oxygenase